MSWLGNLRRGLASFFSARAGGAPASAWAELHPVPRSLGVRAPAWLPLSSVLKVDAWGTVLASSLFLRGPPLEPTQALPSLVSCQWSAAGVNVKV